MHGVANQHRQSRLFFTDTIRVPEDKIAQMTERCQQYRLVENSGSLAHDGDSGEKRSAVLPAKRPAEHLNDPYSAGILYIFLNAALSATAGLQTKLCANLCLNSLENVSVLLKELDRTISPLTDSNILERMPGTRTLDDLLLNRDI